MASADLDIVIPVYNEGQNIEATLDALAQSVRASFRVLICYDMDEDTTLPFVRAFRHERAPAVELVKNPGTGVHAAIAAGLRAATAPAVLVFPADDSYNAGRIDQMLDLFRGGCDIVCASRFIPGGRMEGCRWLKAVLVRTSSFTLYHLGRLPTRDATNGLRLFSQRLLRTVTVESRMGFAYSLELLAKCHRLGWKVGQVPALWFERPHGHSRFRILRWLPEYLRWYRYALATTYLRRGPHSVRRSTQTGAV